jgi:hypothetical protein
LLELLALPHVQIAAPMPYILCGASFQAANTELPLSVASAQRMENRSISATLTLKNTETASSSIVRTTMPMKQCRCFLVGINGVGSQMIALCCQSY